MGEVWDAVVVGGGVMGSCAAYSLAKEGLRTLMLEQFPLPHNRGSSHGKSRIIRMYYEKACYSSMMPRAYALWRELEKVTGKQLIRRCGMLIIEPEDGPKIPGAIPFLEKLGLKYELLDRAEIRRRYPQLEYPDNYRGLLDPDAGLQAPDTVLKILQALFQKHGGVIHDGEKVTSYSSAGSLCRITTSKGNYTAKKVVICAGPWAKDLLEKSGVRLPLKTMPGLASFCREHDEGSHSVDNNFPIVYAPTQDGDKYRFYATFPSWEYPGFVKMVSRGQPPPVYLHPDERDSEGHEEMIGLAMAHVKKYLPGLKPKPSLTEPCVYTMSPDRDFIIDYHPHTPNIILAAGFSGHGFKLGPVIGEMLRDMVLGKQPEFDRTPFRLDRFPTSKL